MKKIRIAIVIILTLSLAFGWAGMFIERAETNRQFYALVQEARDYEGKGLYQKAISSYENALAVKEEKTVRSELLHTYRKGYDDGVVSAKDFGNAYAAACSLYPKDSSYWEDLIEFYLDTHSISKARDTYNSAVKNGAQSERLNELKNEVTYVFSSMGRTFSSVLMSPNGYLAVMNNGKWGIMKPDGEKFADCVYPYAAPVSSKNWTVFVREKDTRVYDENVVVQYVLDVSLNQSGAVSANRIPVCEEDSWRYYNCEDARFETGNYEAASTYCDGIAMVRVNGIWKQRDDSGQLLNAVSFEDVKLYQNGEYCYGGIMVAKKDGRYQIFSPTGEAKNSFTADDIDNYYGGYLAFRADNGLWGYVNTAGDVVIEPQFAEAKSFSGGLAAVSNGEAWGFIQKNGTPVLEYRYANASYFTNDGICAVADIPDSYYFIKLRK